jgi:hypothetical protein
LLRKIFGPKGDEIIGGWRKLYIEKFHKFPSSPNIIRMINSRRMRWAEHVTCIEAKYAKSRRKESSRKIYTYVGRIGWGSVD